MLNHYKGRLDYFQRVVVDNMNVLSTTSDASRLTLVADSIRQFMSIFLDQDVEVRNIMNALNIGKTEVVTHLPKKRSFTERDARSDEDAELLESERSDEGKRCRK